MRFVADCSLESIHPHIRVPATLQNPVALGGGGSGVAVFRGMDDDFGDVVMKHGGHKDSAELFALATVEDQLKQRGREKDAEDSSSFMVAQTPDFRFLYISQDHLRDRGVELWSVVKDNVLAAAGHGAEAPETASSMWGFLHRTLLSPQRRSEPDMQRAKKPSNGIRLCRGTYSPENGARCMAPVDFLDNQLEVRTAVSAEFDEHGRLQCTAPGEGVRYLQRFFKHLVGIQRKRCWKFTLAQKTIGGAHPATGSSLLAKGRLQGGALRTLIDGTIVVMHHLEKLTRPEEKQAIAEVRQVLAKAEEQLSFGASDVPQFVDAYVGFAVRKNFHPVLGRFRKLRDYGAMFRSGKLILDESERLPAKQLGTLLHQGAHMESVFSSGPTGLTALDSHFHSWRELLHRATSLKGEAAQSRIWTCGLTDGGLHNLFLGEDRLWLFDMGEPALTAQPAFLTKFLMSFFHTLGMEETSCGSWVNRFTPEDDGRCGLSAATTTLMPQVFEAFRETLNHIVAEVFEGEAAVCDLLMRYVVLQLLSDAAFCLERWEQKGGGRERFRPQAHSLEKWLWRALWDLYVATDVAGQDWSASRC